MTQIFMKPKNESDQTSTNNRLSVLFCCLLAKLPGALATLRGMPCNSNCDGDTIERLIDKSLKELSPQGLLLALNIPAVECNSFEFDPTYYGGDYSSVGQRAYIPALLLQAGEEEVDAFVWYTRQAAHALIYFNTDESFDQYGNDWNTPDYNKIKDGDDPELDAVADQVARKDAPQ